MSARTVDFGASIVRETVTDSIRVAPTATVKSPGIAEPESNAFGTTPSIPWTHTSCMSGADSLLAETNAPSTTIHETLDVRDLPPPEPLKMTLEAVADLDDDAVVVQVSDRVPQHLFPRLDDRGFAYDTVERDDRVVTAIWRA
jgi:uncharacterized protein (DUF2249 family)